MCTIETSISINVEIRSENELFEGLNYILKFKEGYAREKGLRRLNLKGYHIRHWREASDEILKGISEAIKKIDYSQVEKMLEVTCGSMYLLWVIV